AGGGLRAPGRRRGGGPPRGIEPGRARRRRGGFARRAVVASGRRQQDGVRHGGKRGTAAFSRCRSSALQGSSPCPAERGGIGGGRRRAGGSAFGDRVQFLLRALLLRN